MKQGVLFLMLTMLSLLWGQRVIAYDFEVNGIYYNLNSSYLTATVTSGDTPYKGIVIVPDSVTYKGKTMAITLIGQSAFENCVDLTSVQFGNCINRIDRNAFSGCNNLTSLKIPSNISRIEAMAFSDCFNIKQLTFEDCAQVLGFGDNGEYGPSAVFNCKPKYLYMGRPLGGKKQGYNLDNTDLETLIISNYVTSISGFENSKITELSIPASVTYISEGTFKNCKNLKSVYFEDGVNQLQCKVVYTSEFNYTMEGFSAFYDCPLEYVYIGRPLTSDLNNIYVGRSSGPFDRTTVKHITISSTLSSLCGFKYCQNLQEIDIPASVQEIWGFYGCNSLSTVKCRAINPPNFGKYVTNPFENNTYLNGVLYVPEASIGNYKADKIWGKFFDIQKLTDNPNTKPKCESPNITYMNKKLSFSSNTPNVIFHHTITSPDIITGVNDGEILLSALYRISVYASRADYDNSDETVAYLYWTEANLESSDIQAVRANARGLLIQNSGGFITISGLDNNETVSMYSVGGYLIENSKSISGTAIFNLGRMIDNVVIIKIGNESIKIAL